MKLRLSFTIIIVSATVSKLYTKSLWGATGNSQGHLGMLLIFEGNTVTFGIY